MDACMGLGCQTWPPQVWAAWVQALLSIAAIVGVLLVVRREQRARQRTERDAERLKARSLALLAGAACDEITAGLTAALGLRAVGADAALLGASGRQAAAVPEALRQLIPELYRLGESGALLQDLVLTLQGIASLQRRFDQQVERDPSGAAVLLPFVAEQFELALLLSEEAGLRLANLFEVNPLHARDFDAPGALSPSRPRIGNDHRADFHHPR
ncbi:hypothetical protein [Pseudoxanthomonas winnipegensis]|uniref:hypothetical protein n=1 Tax=Pseudoxanthomonas winnipegensis TaxID=2480810 RepID=UPI0013EED557|nr:hypothetical protein [Pseudoxanthomonas winnipegensis]